MHFLGIDRHAIHSVMGRGVDLYEAKRVEQLTVEHKGEDQEIWKAEIMGTDRYQIEIEVERGRASGWACTCPYDHSAVCKHVLAVALAVSVERES